MVSGDPNFLTFDGLRYEFHGTCVYEMAKMCSSDTELEHFEVLVQNEGQGKHDSSSAKLVEVKIYDHIIVISKEHKGKVMVSNSFVFDAAIVLFSLIQP